MYREEIGTGCVIINEEAALSAVAGLPIPRVNLDLQQSELDVRNPDSQVDHISPRRIWLRSLLDSLLSGDPYY